MGSFIHVDQGAVGTDHHLEHQKSVMKDADAQPPTSQSPVSPPKAVTAIIL